MYKLVNIVCSGSLPLSSARKAWQAWTNFDAYLNELLELKRSEVSSAKTKDLMSMDG